MSDSAKVFTRSFSLLVCVLLLLTTSSTLLSQKETKPAPGADEMLKKIMALGSPGEEHAFLAERAGAWETSSKSWMNGPNEPPIEEKATTEFSMILDGRFLVQNYKGQMMGIPLNGMGIEGYDNVKKKYFILWFDNAGTGYYLAAGTADPTGKIITYFGALDDPMTGERDKTIKFIQRFAGKDEVTLEMHDLSKPDTIAKNWEITYRRKK